MAKPKSSSTPPPRWATVAVGAMLAVLAVYLLFGLRAQPPRLPYSEFKALVASAQVVEVRVGAATIEGVARPDKPFETVRVDDPDLTRELLRMGVKVEGVRSGSFWATFLPWVIPLLLLMLWLPLGRRAQTGQGLLAVGKSKARIYMEKSVGVTFADVAGVDEAKEELAEVIEFLREPHKFERLGAKIPKGVLLVGPPGTGKTLLARAVAGEAGVTFFSISGSEFVELFVGVGAARVRDLFAQAREKAPCIIFIDELDALGKARGAGPMAHEEREQTLNQLLSELDGFDPRVGVILMAATNRPEIIDSALLRAGRFDRHVLVDRPDKAGRLAILKVHARGVAIAEDADLERLAAGTPGLVGADLANLLNEAALLAVRRRKLHVEQVELDDALERIIAGLEKKHRVMNRLEKERVAHHEIGHALAALAVGGSATVEKISIIPRGIAALGYTRQVPTEDRFLMTQRELEDKIAVLLGGRAAEELVFAEISTGAQDDLSKATDIARAMVRSYGMSPTLGARSFDRPHRPLFLEDPEAQRPADESDATTREIDAEVHRILEEQHTRVTHLLEARVDLVRRAADALLRKETLTGSDLRALVQADGRPLALPALQQGATA
jgi:cell division protease FtsH